MVCTALKTCIDALEATGQVAAPDLDRLHDTLYALESLTYFQENMARVALPSILREWASCPFSVTAFLLPCIWGCPA